MKKRISTNLVARAIVMAIVLMLAGPANSAEKSADQSSKKKPVNKIAITFDELPASRSFGEVDRQAVNYLLLETLKRHDVKVTGFVVGEYIEDSFDLLGQWLNNGHRLGNLTYSYQDFNELDPENFIADIIAGSEALETMLQGFGQKKRYFRYPYLHYGSTVEGKRAVREYLEAHEVIVGHATVVVDDFLYNLSLEKMGKVPDSADYEALMNDYIGHVLESIERSEGMARQILKRSCRQILQLRANRLNAVFLDQLLTAIKGSGYQFISLDEALKDKLYSAPEAYYGLRGVGYLEMLQLSDPDLLPAE
ncbi:MAG: polysaccharide deacetylase family protein [candidate division Zixibacteria bacterium]|nr:polysaccharide deacetylase family protein [candidate division Zixibacteria bacterium]